MFQMAETRVKTRIAGGDPAAGAVETLRRETLVLIAKILVAAALVAIVPALWALPNGHYVPFVTAIAALAIGFAMISAVNRQGSPAPVSILLVGVAAIGAGQTMITPGFADFGLATATLVPVLASLLGRGAIRRLGWGLMVATLGFAALSRIVPTGLSEMQAGGAILTSLVTYLVLAVIVSVAALRLGTLLDKVEKAEVETFRHLIDNFHYVVLRLSPAGEPIFVSRSAETLLGCQRYELEGDGLNERVHVQDRPAFLTALSGAANDGSPRMIEMRVRKDDAGSVALPAFIWVECGLSPVCVTDGTCEPFEVMLLMRDISTRVAQREEMNRARLAAQEASEAKSRFLATIGHELRTPLNAIVGFSDMMRVGLGNGSVESQREYADLIHQSGMHLLDTVNMLLDMSKIEAGKFDLQIEEFAPESLIAPSIAMIEPMARSHRIGISVEVDPDLPQILGDERAYRQITINLLSNAIKFSNAGGEVRISLLRRGRNVALSIADNGIGMSKDVVARLGEPFFQAHEGLSRKFEGSGLGLSIVKGLIELHEGRLDVQSRPGKGSVMTVLMPISGPHTVPAPTGIVKKLDDSRPAPSSSSAVRQRAVL